MESSVKSMISVASVCFLIFFFILRKLSALISNQFLAYRQLSELKKAIWNDRNNSTIHAAVSSFLAGFVAFTDANKDNPLGSGSWLAKFVLSICIGYSIADGLFIALYYPSTEDGYWGTLIHHACMAISYVVSVLYGLGVYICVIRTLAELSTPFVNLRWMLAECNLKQSRLYVINGLAMTIAFFFSRIITMPYCYKTLYDNRHTEEFVRMETIIYCCLPLVIILDILNMFWFIKIVRGILKYFTVTGKDNRDVKSK